MPGARVRAGLGDPGQVTVDDLGLQGQGRGGHHVAGLGDAPVRAPIVAGERADLGHAVLEVTALAGSMSLGANAILGV